MHAHTLSDADAYIEALLDDAVDAWWKLATAGHYRIFLAFKPTNPETGEGGTLAVFPAGQDGPAEGFELLGTMNLNTDREQTRAYLSRTVRQLPILPTEARQT